MKSLLGKITVFFGFDETARDQELSKIRTENKGCDWDVFQEDDFLRDKENFFANVRAASLTPSLFFTQRAVFVKGSFLTDSQLKELLDFLPENPEAAVIISCGEIGATVRKKFAQKTVFNEFKKFYEKDFVIWVKEELNKTGRKFDRGIPELLYRSTGGKKDLCLSEISKLVLHSLEDSIVTAEAASEVLCFTEDNEWITSEILKAFFVPDRRETLRLLKRLFQEKKELLFFEQLRDAFRALVFFICESENVPADEFIILSKKYHQASSEKQFWKISGIFSEAAAIFSRYFSDLPDDYGLKNEKPLVFYGQGLSWINKKNIRKIYTLLNDYEADAKNRYGFTPEGIELLLFRIWESRV